MKKTISMRVRQALAIVALCALSIGGAYAQSEVAPGNDAPGGKGKGLSNGRSYDVRKDKDKKEKLANQKYAKKPGKSRKDKLDNRGQEMKAARARILESVPNAEVTSDDDLDAAETVTAKNPGKGKFLASSSGENEKTLRGFVSKYADLYGLTPRQVAQLKKSADYANPAGNLSWVELKQEIKGVPVFQGELRAAFTRDGELAHTVGRLVPDVDDSDAIDDGADALTVSAAQAVAIGAQSLGVSLQPSELVLKETTDEGRTLVFDKGPFDEDIRVTLNYFPIEAGVVTPAWSMTLWQADPAFYTLVDADGGDVLWQKNITNEQTQPATYVVYNSDSPAPMSPFPFNAPNGAQGTQVARTSFTLISEGTLFNNLGWITDGGTTTTGNNVDAGLDLAAPNGIDAGSRPVSATRVFNFDYNPGPGLAGALGSSAVTNAAYRNGVVTNMFFWSNRYHDRLYQLGFTEAARNFQTNNFGRGGLGNDSVRAEGQDSSGTNNANFSTPADGSQPRMQMYVWPNPSPQRDGDIDQEIMLHELTHGTSNRLHANASGLGVTVSQGMGEGWSDFYALSLLSEPGDDANGIYAMGAYATYLATAGYTNNYYSAIRRFPYAVKTNVGANGKPHNPLTLADTNVNTIDLTDGAAPRGPFGQGGRAGATAVHNMGEVWNTALWEVRSRIITRLGHAVGNQRMMQLVTDAMKLDPVNPTHLTGRNSLLAADAASLFGNQDELDIWEGFATRGMGFGATMLATNTNGKESFDFPIPGMGAVTFTDSSCNANGIADAGEDLVLTVPLTNPLSITLTDVTATVGGATVSYGTLAPGQTVTKQLLYTVPAASVAGSEITASVVVTSNKGTQTKALPIRIGGTPVITFSENFDGVTAPALPAGWTALVNPVTAPVWRTVNTSTVSPPNAAFVTSSTTTNLSFLQSPVIPISSPTARVQWRHSYNTEFEWDGAILQVSIGGAAYIDVLDSGPGAKMIDGGMTFGLITSGNGNTNGLQARPAWTGLSGGFITTTIQLPTTAAGSTIQFRWIAGSDSADTVANNGWTIDDVKIIDTITPLSANCLANLAISNTVVPSTVVTSTNATYTVNVTNNGPARATDIVVSDAIPSGMTFKSATAPAGWTAVTPAVGSAGTITFSTASLDATASASFQIVLKAECGTANGTTISNTAKVSSPRDTATGDNSSTATITASDPAAVITAPANIVVPADPGQPTAIVTFAATVSDNCSATLSYSPASGSAFPLGTTTVTITATDSTGNISTATFTVTVNDGQAPIISSLTVDKPIVLFAPNHKMEDIVVNYSVFDNSGASVVVVTVSSNEPIDGLGDGDTAPDWEIVDLHHVRVRAERSGKGDGRIYTITVTATDAAGNVTAKSVTVTVPKGNSNN